MSRYLYATLGALLAIYLAACSSDNNPSGPDDEVHQQADLVELGAGDDQGVHVALMGPVVLKSGYNVLSVRLTDNATGGAIHSAAVAIRPIMHMVRDDGSTMSHSAPAEPPASHEATDGAFIHPIVLSMPGTWQLHVDFADAAGQQGSVMLNVEVTQGHAFTVFEGEDGVTYQVALIAPGAPEVGPQDLELAIFQRESMMSFPPVTDLRLEVEPTMPSMGHGSPGNEHPQHLAHGHYTGLVNFTMTGDWRLDLTLWRGDVLVGNTQFDMLVE